MYVLVPEVIWRSDVMLNCPGCWTPSSNLAQVLMVAANTERSATRMMLGWSVWSQNSSFGFVV